MQELKELIAWGGTHTDVADKDLPAADIDPKLTDFFADGYLQGWGLTPSKVDLEVGTAIFVRRMDVANWNSNIVRRIQDTHNQDQYGDLQGVDIVSCDPRTNSTPEMVLKGAPTKRTGGKQYPHILQLRANPRHRMRVMLLNNCDVKHGWANGTRARLLATNSWTGPCSAVQRNSEKCGTIAERFKLKNMPRFQVAFF